jgi:hypothetical protein
MSDIGPGATTPPAPPANAAEARTRLDALIADRDRGARLLSGDHEVNREYRELRAKADAPNPADEIGAAIAGVEQPGPFQDSGHVQRMHTAAMLKENGISDGAIRQALDPDYEVLPEAHGVVASLKADAMADPEWRKRFLAGGRKELREYQLMNIELHTKVKDVSGRF